MSNCYPSVYCHCHKIVSLANTKIVIHDCLNTAIVEQDYNSIEIADFKHSSINHFHCTIKHRTKADSFDFDHLTHSNSNWLLSLNSQLSNFHRELVSQCLRERTSNSCQTCIAHQFHNICTSKSYNYCTVYSAFSFRPQMAKCPPSFLTPFHHVRNGICCLHDRYLSTENACKGQFCRGS